MKSKHSLFIPAIILITITLSPIKIPAQELVQKASFSGLPISSWTNANDSDPGILLLDFNKDGVPDKPFIDYKNKSIVIFDGSNRQQKWVISLSGLSLNFEEIKLLGFYEMDGDTGTTEIVIANRKENKFWAPVVLNLDKSSPKLQEDNILASPGYFLIGINDIDNDGKEDIIVANSIEKSIEMWGY